MSKFQILVTDFRGNKLNNFICFADNLDKAIEIAIVTAKKERAEIAEVLTEREGAWRSDWAEAV